MTISQIIKLARIKLLEQTSEVVADETLLTYANLVDMDMVKRTFTLDKLVPTTLTFSSGEATKPEDFGAFYGVGKDSNGGVYQEVSPEDFERRVLSRMMTIEGNKIKVYPLGVTKLDIKYYPTFRELTPGSEPSVNEYFHECYVYGIIARAFEDLQDEELSSYYTAKYEALANQRASIQSNYEERNLTGGQLFNQINII